MSIGGVSCTSESIVASETQITCTLASGPSAGSWDVKVTDAYGLIPLSAPSPITVSLTVDGVSPDANVNVHGGDLLTISGSGFPSDASLIQVSFEDFYFCDIVSTMDTEVTCTLGKINTDSVDISSPLPMTVIVAKDAQAIADINAENQAAAEAAA